MTGIALEKEQWKYSWNFYDQNHCPRSYQWIESWKRLEFDPIFGTGLEFLKMKQKKKINFMQNLSKKNQKELLWFWEVT